MFNAIGNVKVSVKLIAGFLVVAGIAAFIGIMGISGAKEIAGYVDTIYNVRLKSVRAVAQVEGDLVRIRLASRLASMATSPADFQKQQGDINDGFKAVEANMELVKGLLSTEKGKAYFAELEKNYAQMKAGMPVLMATAEKYPVKVDSVLEVAYGEIRAVSNAAVKSADELGGFNAGVAEEIFKKAEAGSERVATTMLALLICGAVLAVLLGYFLSSSISKPLTRTVAMLKDLSLGHLATRLRMTRGDEIGIMASTMDKFADDLQHQVIGTMKQIASGDLSADVKAYDAQDEIRPALIGTIDALRGLIIEDGGRVLEAAAAKDLSQRLERDYKGEYAKMKANINTLVENLDEAMAQVAEAVGQVSSASGQISQGSQSLAEGANEQASSLEEVSSSLEEMSSMTKQNADNSNHAKSLMAEAGTAVTEADGAMKRMATAIQEIKTSSDNTAKILKTIDDIAFQTNLLALNAAVEAARAGEAGKGFAVVAEEVRNLAMRSAEAAKNTANMIEESVKNAEGGVKITEDVAKALGKTVESSTKVSDLIAEIAAASNEQAQGIEQVNTAVAQMNQVTQQNAANSEESASAAEELNSQAAELSNMVGTFTLSSSGGARRPRSEASYAAASAGTQVTAGSRASKAIIPLGSGLAKPGLKRPSRAPITAKMPAVKVGTGTAAAVCKAVTPEEVIPLDDDELMEF